MGDVAKIAAGLTDEQRASCHSCGGKGYHQYSRKGERYECLTCKEPEPEVVAIVLAKITPEQRAYLLVHDATLAEHPVTPEVWDAHLCRLYVEADDAVDLGDGYEWPATQHWFGATHAHYAGDGGDWKLWHSYNATGLAVRAHLLAPPTDEQTEGRG